VNPRFVFQGSLVPSFPSESKISMHCSPARGAGATSFLEPCPRHRFNHRSLALTSTVPSAPTKRRRCRLKENLECLFHRLREPPSGLSPGGSGNAHIT